VLRLWDDPDAYARASAAARAEVRLLYGEETLRKRYRAYFETPPPYPPVFLDEVG
jgi:hypothetical protein